MALIKGLVIRSEAANVALIQGLATRSEAANVAQLIRAIAPRAKLGQFQYGCTYFAGKGGQGPLGYDTKGGEIQVPGTSGERGSGTVSPRQGNPGPAQRPTGSKRREDHDGSGTGTGRDGRGTLGTTGRDSASLQDVLERNSIGEIKGNKPDIYATCSRL